MKVKTVISTTVSAGARRAWVPLVSVLLLGACQTGPHAAGTVEGAAIQDFLVVNRGSSAVTEIYIRPSGTKNWSDDIIYSDVLPAEQYMLDVPNDIDICLWDVKFVDAVGNTEVDRDVDLCSGRSIVFNGGD
jgi:hypothetical protein